MQILSLSLKNFKTHRDKYFTFSQGTNAICGENGAGKTSILEAIAWTLFNYQGEYAKEDLIRNGSNSAEVTVEFISHHDGRTYAVQRSTTKGYTIFDPQLNARLPYSRIKDEVLPWLRTHLGVAPGTDLGELFARTIGVPQGTFTADFLQSPENRKTIFDKILKVEEYKMAFKELNALRHHAENQVAAVEQEIASYEERLAGWDALNQRYQTLGAELAMNRAQLMTFEQQIATLQAERDALKAQAERVQQLQAQQQQLQAQLDGKQQAIALLTQSLTQAQEAVNICADTRPAYDAYQRAEADLQVLSQQQAERQALQRKQQQLRKTLESRATDLTRLRVQLEELQTAAEAMAQLQPQVQVQIQLEEQIQTWQQQQTALAQARGTLTALVSQQADLEQQEQRLSADIARLEGVAQSLTSLPEMEQQRDRLQQHLSRLEAARQFEADLRQLVRQGQQACDRLQAEATEALAALLKWEVPETAIAPLRTALESGVAVSQDLLAQVQQILADLTTQTDAKQLQAQLKAVQAQLADLSKQQAMVAALPERQQALTQLQQQQADLSTRIQALQAELAGGETLAAQLTQAQSALKALEDPKGRYGLLAQSLQQQPALQRRYDEMQAAQGGIQRQIDDLETQLQDFADLEAAIATQTALKQTHQAAYLQYLQYERAAQAVPRLAADLAAAQAELSTLQQGSDRLQTELEAALASFDPQQAQQIDAAYQATRSERDRLAGSLPQQEKLLAELQRQIDELTHLATQRDAAEVERKRRERVKRFITFARKAYKEAGPRITERYVKQISLEGDRLFRELLNRPNVALTWTRDYEIQVQEGPNTRRFINLSGGEQMCAALAVRLALLKVLADIDIAFFDEPTTNMDRARRASLAEAIGRLKSFNQLFVISHDDTFETVTENVILVERDNGQ